MRSTSCIRWRGNCLAKPQPPESRACLVDRNRQGASVERRRSGGGSRTTCSFRALPVFLLLAREAPYDPSDGEKCDPNAKNDPDSGQRGPQRRPPSRQLPWRQNFYASDVRPLDTVGKKARRIASSSTCLEAGECTLILLAMSPYLLTASRASESLCLRSNEFVVAPSLAS